MLMEILNQSMFGDENNAFMFNAEITNTTNNVFMSKFGELELFLCFNTSLVKTKLREKIGGSFFK